jgi:hypothetical protein
MKLLKKWWQRITDFFFRRKLRGIETKLENAVVDRIQKRRELKKEIEAHVALKLKGREKSKYIPPKLKREILDTVYQQFGPRMREVNLYLKPNLEYNV